MFDELSEEIQTVLIISFSIFFAISIEPLAVFSYSLLLILGVVLSLFGLTFVLIESINMKRASTLLIEIGVAMISASMSSLLDPGQAIPVVVVLFVLLVSVLIYNSNKYHTD